MKTNDFARSSHPPDQEKQPALRSDLESDDEAHGLECPYCIESENDDSSPVSSPSVTRDTANIALDEVYLSSTSDCESSAEFKKSDPIQPDRSRDMITQTTSNSFAPTTNEHLSPKQSKKKIVLPSRSAQVLDENGNVNVSTAHVDTLEPKSSVRSTTNIKQSKLSPPTDSQQSIALRSIPTQSRKIRKKPGSQDQRTCHPHQPTAYKYGGTVGVKKIVADKLTAEKHGPHSVYGQHFDARVIAQYSGKPAEITRNSKTSKLTKQPSRLPPETVTRLTATAVEKPKPISRLLEKNLPLEKKEETAKNAVSKSEKTQIPLVPQVEIPPAVGVEPYLTKVEFSKLETGGPALVESGALCSLTVGKNSISGTRPMKRCAVPAAQPQQPLRIQPMPSMARKSHPEKPTADRLNTPFHARSHKSRSTSAQSSTAPRYTSNREFSPSSNRSLSIEDVGTDGAQAFVIRKESRGKVDWRRKPRYKVKQTATSRLRYGYWFADCGRQRVKAYRGDWSQIPEDLLRDWEVYQNYFRYRLKGRRKRTSSIVRKFIAGKYRHKKSTPFKKRPIRRMSPLLPAKKSSPMHYEYSRSVPLATKPPLKLRTTTRGSNVRELLIRRARTKQRQQSREQQQLAPSGRGFNAYRNPQIEVHSTFTSRLRKGSTTEICAKPMTPTLWHGSADEMIELKRKIANRRQRLKQNWLQQAQALETITVGGANKAPNDTNVGLQMARMICVGASTAMKNNIQQCHVDDDLKDVGDECIDGEKQAYASGAIVENAASLMRVHVIKQCAAETCSTLPETGWQAHNIDVLPDTCIVNHEPSLSVTSAHLPLRKRKNVKKTNSLVTFRKLFNFAKCMLPPTRSVKDKLTSTVHQHVNE